MPLASQGDPRDGGSMFSCFTIPKAFQEPGALLQRNAIRSWQAALPEAEILLLGDDRGVREAAADLGVRHVPAIARNEFGTPLVNAAFEAAEAAASHPLLCYFNADILLLDRFPLAISQAFAKHPRALLTGQRLDLDVTGELPWDLEGRRSLRQRVSLEGVLRSPAAMDYFIFAKGTLEALPPFAIGRPGWDNWLVYHARQLGLPVVDISEVVTVVHQNHDYSHLREGEAEFRNGPESVRNQELAGGYRHFYTLQDATHRLTPAGLRTRHPWAQTRVVYRFLMRLSERWPTLKPWVRALKTGYKALMRVPR